MTATLVLTSSADRPCDRPHAGGARGRGFVVPGTPCRRRGLDDGRPSPFGRRGHTMQAPTEPKTELLISAGALNREMAPFTPDPAAAGEP